MVTLRNLITDASFENDGWTDAGYSTEEKLSGNRSLFFAAGTSLVASIPIAMPILDHKYYGRRYAKTDGDNQPADCRFEIYGGDGEGLNWVFAWNRGNYSEWNFDSAIHEITTLNFTANAIVRCFNINTTANMWIDNLMIIDLTEAFGAGNEPTKEWCDVNIPFFEGSLTYYQSEELNKGDILDFTYTGAPEGLVLPAGMYKLEAWGAQGGTYDSAIKIGGKGGYSQGILKLKKQTMVYVRAGGAGVASTNSTYTAHAGGGWNGGGNAGYRGGGGGGASDIRIGEDSLYARVLVAGGGGGSNSYSSTYAAQGGAGGGGEGIRGWYLSTYSGYPGGGGTQTAGGAGGTGSTAACNGNPGTFGRGGDTGNKYNSTSYYSNGAGGGGWYGGGAAGNYNSSSNAYATGGSGGSGYVYTASTAGNYPDGCLLNEQYYLLGGLTQSGEATIFEPDGTIIEGHSGNGVVRITLLDIIQVGKLGEMKITQAFGGNNLFVSGAIGNTKLWGDDYTKPQNPSASNLLITRAEIDKGTFTNGTVSYLDATGFNNTDGFTIVGRSANTAADDTVKPKWAYTADLTDYTTFKLHARKNVDHGSLQIIITNNGLKTAAPKDYAKTMDISYRQLGMNTWYEFALDISKLQGEYTIYIIGGYWDNTGATGSSTSFSNIQFLI